MSQDASLRALVAAFCAASASACHALGTTPSAMATTSLHLTGSPAHASVTIDDLPVGSVAEVSRRGVALPPGSHRVTIEALGYFPHDTVVVAKSPKAPINLTIELDAVPE